MPAPSLIVFAGPIGAGKSTLKRHLSKLGYPLGEYINPDEIAEGLTGSYEERARAAQHLADAKRQECLLAGSSFAFETVMSHPSKIEFMRLARNAGFLVTLYFIGVETVETCLLRVAQRVLLGGHDVPAAKIQSRYLAALASLPQAITASHRTLVFDNSISNPDSPFLGPRVVGEVIGDRMATYPPVPSWIGQFPLFAKS